VLRPASQPREGQGGCAVGTRRRACCERHPRARGCGPTHDGSTRTYVLDDLYLRPEPRNPRHGGSSASPPVIRSFTACERGAAAAAAVQHALNQTARARTQLADSPLPILAAIYFGTHYERLPTLRAYERYFQRVVYVSPSPEIATALRMSDRAISAPGAVAEGRSGWPPRTHHCRQSNKEPSSSISISGSSRGLCYSLLRVLRVSLEAPKPPRATAQMSHTTRVWTRCSTRCGRRLRDASCRKPRGPRTCCR
jgi:hypothetical protein